MKRKEFYDLLDNASNILDQILKAMENYDGFNEGIYTIGDAETILQNVRLYFRSVKRRIEAHDKLRSISDQLSLEADVEEIYSVSMTIYIANNINHDYKDSLKQKNFIDAILSHFMDILFIGISVNPEESDNPYIVSTIAIFLKKNQLNDAELKQEINSTNLTIKSLDKKTKSLSNEINKILSDNENIRALTSELTERYFSAEFADRARKSFYWVLFWGGCSFLFLALTAYTLYFQYDISNLYVNPSPTTHLPFFTKGIPLALMTFFLFRQYIKERNIMEEYKFKSILAITMNPMKDQITNPDVRDNITDRLTKMLYRSPLDHIYRNKTSDDMPSIKDVLNLISKRNVE